MATEKKMDYAILGLLSHKSHTGYEIKKTMDTALNYFWSASYGSIYPTLSSLEEKGMVTGAETKENGRVKHRYSITEDGRKYLRDWLCLPVQKDEIRYETLLKIFFGSEIGDDKSLEHIADFKEKIKKELSELESAVNVLEQIKETKDAHLYYLLTAKAGVKVYKAFLEWCGETEALLKSKQKQEAL